MISCWCFSRGVCCNTDCVDSLFVVCNGKMAASGTSAGGADSAIFSVSISSLCREISEVFSVTSVIFESSDALDSSRISSEGLESCKSFCISFVSLISSDWGFTTFSRIEEVPATPSTDVLFVLIKFDLSLSRFLRCKFQKKTTSK